MVVGPPGINMKCKDKYILVMKAFYMQKKQTYKSIINDVAWRQWNEINEITRKNTLALTCIFLNWNYKRKKVSLIKAFIVYAKNKKTQDKIKMFSGNLFARQKQVQHFFPSLMTAVKPAIIWLWWEISVTFANVFKSY